MKAITLANLKRLLDPEDKIEPGSHYFTRTVGGFVDPCVATIYFGDGVLTMHVTQSGRFTVGSACAPMSRAALAACARAHRLVAKAGLYDGELRIETDAAQPKTRGAQ